MVNALRGLCLGLAVALGVSGTALAKVERMEIVSRSSFADGHRFGAVGAYEKIRGRIHYSVDPESWHNHPVVDLDLAPRDDDGLVRFSGEFLMFRPRNRQAGNGTLLYDVTNRGRLTVLGVFNSVRSGNDPETLADAGNRFLFRQGYTLLMSGWNWDVPEDSDGLSIDLPIARAPDGTPLTGAIAHEFHVREATRTAFIAGISARGYPLVDTDNAVLTVRDTPYAPRRVIPRDRWQLAQMKDGEVVPSDVHITAETPFQPDKIYELVATAAKPRVVGLGMAAMRDAIAHVRAQPDNRIDTALAFGHSQSGRLIATMLRDGLHVDAEGRSVFDGAFIRVAGGGKGSFNHRFAQTTRHFSQFEELIYPTDMFPFSPSVTDDPLTGRRGGLLETARDIDRRRRAGTLGQPEAAQARAPEASDDAAAADPAAGPQPRGAVPKLFFTNSSAEYWARAASLMHTTPMGRADLAPPEEAARIYAILGAQHFHARWADRRGLRYCVNPIDKRPVARALLGHLTRWARDGVSPPDSRYPTLADGTLVRAKAALQDLPESVAPFRPDAPLTPPLLDHGPRFETAGVADRVPPVVMGHYRTLVPASDRDGNDRGGVGLPHLAVPLGTHLGWNPRSLDRGGPEAISRWLGSFHPFARTREERRADDDRRPSLSERYDGREDFRARFRKAVEDFADAGFIREQETPAIVEDWVAFYDRLMARPADAVACGYLAGADES